MSDLELREEFEKWWSTWTEQDIELTSIVKADARYVFKAGAESAQVEINELKKINDMYQVYIRNTLRIIRG